MIASSDGLGFIASNDRMRASLSGLFSLQRWLGDRGLHAADSPVDSEPKELGKQEENLSVSREAVAASPQFEWPDISYDGASLSRQLARKIRSRRIRAVYLGLTRHPGFPSRVAEVDHLRNVGYSPRVGIPPVALTPPIDWEADPYLDRNWRIQLNMLRIVDPYIGAYETTRLRRYLRPALQICLDWHDYHVVHHRRHKFAWCDMATGVRALRLAYLADHVRKGTFPITHTHRRLLADAILAHWRRFVSPRFFQFTNHSIYDLHGLTALVRVACDDTEVREQWESRIASHLTRLLDSQFDSYGVHLENSPAYQFVALTMFRPLRASGWYNKVESLTNKLAAAEAASVWMKFPDGRFLPIGDTDGQKPKARSAARLRVPRSPLEFMNHSGYCIIRQVDGENAWSTLAIKAGFTTTTHLHHDDLSYVWAESGHDLVTDPGKFAYDTGPMHSYMRSARAHNVIEFDEPGVAAARKVGHLVRSVSLYEWGVRVHAETSYATSALTHSRRYFFAPGRWLVIDDRFEATRPVSFTHWTHMAPEFPIELIETTGDNAILATMTTGGHLNICYRSTVDTILSNLCGVDNESVQGWVSRGYKAVDPAMALGLSGRAASARLIQGLSLEMAGVLERGDMGVVWRCGNERVALQD